MNKIKLIIIVISICNIMLFGHSINSNTKLDYGYLLIQSNIVKIDSIYIVIDEDFGNCIKKSIFDYIQLHTGSRKIRIITKDYDDDIINIDVSTGDTIIHQISFSRTISRDKHQLNNSYIWAKTGRNVTVITDSDSDILIDGFRLGQGVLNADVPLRKHKIVTSNKLAGTTKINVNLLSKEQRTFVMYNRPEKTRAKLLCIFPGASQLYKNEKIKGFLFFGFSALCGSLSIKYHINYIVKNDDYEWRKKIYDNYTRWCHMYNSGNISASTALGDRVQHDYDAAKKAAKRRDIFLYSTIGIYLINVMDSFLSNPPGGYRVIKNDEVMKGLSVSVNYNVIRFQYFLSI